MNLVNKKHREIEKEHNCKKNSLKEAVAFLLNRKDNLEEVVKGCEDYCNMHGNSFEVAFNLYVSCLKDHTKKKSNLHYSIKNTKRKIAQSIVKILK